MRPKQHHITVHICHDVQLNIGYDASLPIPCIHTHTNFLSMFRMFSCYFSSHWTFSPASIQKMYIILYLSLSLSVSVSVFLFLSRSLSLCLYLFHTRLTPCTITISTISIQRLFNGSYFSFWFTCFVRFDILQSSSLSLLLLQTKQIDSFVRFQTKWRRKEWI